MPRPRSIAHTTGVVALGGVATKRERPVDLRVKPRPRGIAQSAHTTGVVALGVLLGI